MDPNRISYTELELASLRHRAYAMLDARRVPHVAGCEEEAVCLAGRGGAEPSAAAAAAILHDVTKNLTVEGHMALMLRYGATCSDELLACPKILHAVTGALVAEHEFGMPEEICSAIRWHTTGRPDMTLLEKIIYLADYIEPTRAFDGLDSLRKASYEDLDAALALGMRMSLAEVRRSGAEPYFETEKAYTFYQHAANISE